MDLIKLKKFISKLTVKPSKAAQDGFTLMEIMVATTIFVVVMVALMSLFNYTLKINRRTEALRQATQGMRDFVETLVKDVRNGQIDYGLVDPAATTVNTSYPPPCTAPVVNAGVPANTFSSTENKLAIVTLNGDEECIYLAFGPGATGGSLYGYVGNNVFTSNSGNPNPVLVLQKNNLAPQVMTPTNFRVESFNLFIRPQKDPYAAGGGYAKIQPFVAMAIKFVAQLPTGEQVPIYYQTAVSTAKYDIPNSP